MQANAFLVLSEVYGYIWLNTIWGWVSFVPFSWQYHIHCAFGDSEQHLSVPLSSLGWLNSDGRVILGSLFLFILGQLWQLFSVMEHSVTLSWLGQHPEGECTIVKPSGTSQSSRDVAQSRVNGLYDQSTLEAPCWFQQFIHEHSC